MDLVLLQVAEYRKNKQELRRAKQEEEQAELDELQQKQDEEDVCSAELTLFASLYVPAVMILHAITLRTANCCSLCCCVCVSRLRACLFTRCTLLCCISV